MMKLQSTMNTEDTQKQRALKTAAQPTFHSTMNEEV